MARFKLIVVCIVLLMLGVVAYQNREPVDLKLTFYQVTIPVTALIFFSAILGFSAGIIFGVRIPRNLKVTMPPDKKGSKSPDPSAEAEPSSEENTGKS